MRYLLDTNIVSDLIRNPQGRIAEQIRKIGEAQVCTSIIVAAELRYGATKNKLAARNVGQSFINCTHREEEEAKRLAPPMCWSPYLLCSPNAL
jgi:predicted nucleic acid-binding protein